jgi:DNA-binding HxlR family transcriptional regulator
MPKANSTNAQNKAALTSACPMQHVMNQLSGRWKILLVWYIHLGLNRFGAIRKRLPGLSTKMLSQQLRELERDGFLHKKVFAEVPPHVEYYITEKAKGLIPIFEKLNDWGRADQLLAKSMTADTQA